MAVGGEVWRSELLSDHLGDLGLELLDGEPFGFDVGRFASVIQYRVAEIL